MKTAFGASTGYRESNRIVDDLLSARDFIESTMLFNPLRNAPNQVEPVNVNIIAQDCPTVRPPGRSGQCNAAIDGLIDKLTPVYQIKSTEQQALIVLIAI